MITSQRSRTEPLLKLLFAKCDTDHAALDDRLRSAGRFCAAAVGTVGGGIFVASGQDGKAYLVSIAREGAALCVERLQPQGASAACCTFGLRTLLLPVGKLHSAFVHHLEAFVVVNGPSNACQMLRLSLEAAQPVSQRRERVQLVPSTALPPPGPMLSAVDGGAGAAYLLACGGRRLFRLRCADQSLEELTQHGWPCDRQAVALWVHASKLLALTRKHPSCHGTAAAEHLDVWELPVAEAAVAGGGKWEPVAGSDVELPSFIQGCNILAAPYQGDQWLVVQQPQLQQPAPGASESLATAVVLVYSMCSNGWSAPGSLQPASFCGHTSPHTLQPSIHLDGIRKEVGKPSYFQQAVDSTGSLAISTAAVAGFDALQRHMAACPHGDGMGPLQQQRQQEMAVVADTQGGALAVWREWAPLKPIRLGEIASPESLPYSLRQAQALRAALVSPGIIGSHTGTDLAAAEASSGDDAHSDVMLQVTSLPPLPAIICPRIVAQQCGELLRQLEVLEEAGAEAGSWRGDGGQPIQLQQLVLTGVSHDEHAALQQLVNCLAGKTHAGLLEATQLLDVTRLADLLDAPALLEECVAVLACIVPGAQMVAPMLALAEARQYHPALQRLALFYRHALGLMMLSGQRSLLEWALHGLAAGVDTILEVCTEVANTWLPLEPEKYLGSPGSDLTALASLKCHQQPPESLRMLLAALTVLLDRRQRTGFEQAGVQRSNGVAKKARVGSGAFTSAASRPACDPAVVHGLQYHALVPYLQRLLQQLQRALPREAAWRRCEFTAAAFQAAEARARRHQHANLSTL